MTPAMERMVKGRVGLIAREPFFATLALEKLTLVEDPKCKSTWTDGRRLGFNPEHVLAADSIDVIESIWAHHVATCALGHHLRRGARQEKLWNDASDHVVNSYISGAGFKLPEGSLCDPRFEGMYVEQVYHQLKQEEMPDDGQQPDDASDGSDSGAGGGGSASGDPGGVGSGGGDQDDPAGADADSPEGGSDDVPGDAPDPGEEAAGAGATGTVRDATNDLDETASAAEMAEQARDWETSVAQASQAATGAGRLSGNAARLAKAVADAKVDWREAFQRLIKARSKDDYSYRRPSKRSPLFGCVLPSLDAPRCGPLGFAIDYSGSTTQRDINQFVAEVEDARLVLNPVRVHVWVFDHGIQGSFTFESGEPIDIPSVRAQGGTSFVEPVLAANELEEPLEVLAFLTDLDGTAFAPEPTYPVVWVTTRNTFAPYGDVISMF